MPAACDKRVKMRPLYLYGAPASGKSTLARQLAERFGASMVDLDAAIVERAGMSIPEIFATRGEAAFREFEAEELRRADVQIVALGGGTLLREDSRKFAEEHGFVVVLDVPDEVLARRIAEKPGARPLGDKARERRAHYASFAHHMREGDRLLLPAQLSGVVRPPVSKSHLHRLLIARFLAGAEDFAAIARAQPQPQSEDIAATVRCLEAMGAARSLAQRHCTLDCGESGSTLRFLAPVAAALGLKPQFVLRGRLAQRPMIDFSTLAPGVQTLRGDISSQFVTGLLFALPLLEGDSEIRLSTPLESRGYVDMTLGVLALAGIKVEETAAGFFVPGRQRYRMEGIAQAEGDWSSAAFWIAASALGAKVDVTGLAADSRQPDRAVSALVCKIAAPRARGEVCEIDISPCPDLYPALAVVAAATDGVTRFVNAARLRLKESDRIAAMEAVLGALGVNASSSDAEAQITGRADAFEPCEIDSAGDHRIAMAAAIASTRASGPVLLHGAGAVAKSYPAFWEDFFRLTRIAP